MIESLIVADWYDSNISVNSILIPPEQPLAPGDLNNDGLFNILDVILLVNIVLADNTSFEFGDINEDDYLNILDIIALINIILFP